MENRSYYKRVKVDAFFQEKLVEILSSVCPKALLVKPGDPGYPDFLSNIPRRDSGAINNINLALAGRLHGFNALVTGAVVDIAAYQEKSGIFWLRDTHSFIQIQILVEMFDTETGAKLLDENFIHEVEVDETDYLLIKKKKQASIPEIPESLAFVAKNIAEKICDALNAERWKSYILSKDGKRVVIPAGRKAGIRQGMVLAVYDDSKAIKGAGAEQFFLPGAKTGEIRITSVHPDKSEAVIISDTGIQVGGTVKIK